jgi:dihydrofolate reductase
VTPRHHIAHTRSPHGKIVANFFISLDGVVESPDQWHFPYFNDETGAAIGAGAATTGAFLMGRTLYQEWSAFWPDHDEDFGTVLNSAQKYVLSDGLTEATWNNTTIIRGADAVAELQRLKDTMEGNLTLSGSATTVRWLLANGLLDELTLLVHPLAVGKGQRLFVEGESVPLSLVSSAAFSTGVVHSVYAPAPAG